jgi:hypothetical protein
MSLHVVVSLALRLRGQASEPVEAISRGRSSTAPMLRSRSYKSLMLMFRAPASVSKEIAAANPAA